MIRLADRRYSDPEWERFRRHLDAWQELGCWPALARLFCVSNDTLERWRLGTSTPPTLVRDRVLEPTFVLDVATRITPR